MTVDASSKTLIIIEAPGKIARLKNVLSGLSYSNYDIIATKGRLYDIPDNQTLFDFDNLEDSLSEPLNPSIIESIKEKSSTASKIIIMTDNDSEGELIAFHASTIVNKEGSIFRGRFNSLKRAEIRRALESITPYERSDEVNAKIAERIVDRIIGYKKSTLFPYSTIGTVLSPALKTVDDEFGEPIAHNPTPKPNFYDTVKYISMVEDTSPSKITECMQELYEAGDISYYRTKSHTFSPETIKELGYQSHLLGLRLSEEKKSLAKKLKDYDAHEGLHVTRIDESVILNGPSSFRDKVLLHIMNISTHSLSNASVPISNKPDSSYQYRKEIKVLEILQKSNLSSPSTAISHMSKICGKYMNDLGLNGKGLNSLRYAMTEMPKLLVPEAIMKSQKICSNNTLSIKERVIKALESLNYSSSASPEIQHHAKPNEELTL